MWIVTIYDDGVRCYSAPVPEPKEGQDTIIKGRGIQVDYTIYSDGNRFHTLYQEITPEEFEIYKKDPLPFTANKIF